MKLSKQTIRNWVAAGTLPCVRVGARRVRVWRSDFQALLDGSSTSATGRGAAELLG